jgi:hypothetical protein
MESSHMQTSDNRRLHQCRADGCSSQAEWQLMLQCRCLGASAFMLKMPSTLMVCDKHVKAAMELATNDHAKGQLRIAAFQQGWGMPDFSSMVAMFAPVEHDKVEGNA